MSVAAFFDVDGTLYTAHMWRGLMKYATQHGRANRVRLYFAGLVPLYGLRKVGLIGEEAFRAPWIIHMGWLLRGWSEAEAKKAFRWVAEEYIGPTGRADTIARVQEHLASQHVVVLVSGMLAPALQILGDALGVMGTVGTAVQFQAGRFVRVIPPVCMGIEKDRLTRRFLTENQIQVDWSASYAYADSISDRELLEMVGHPVAVYPDAPLAALALKKNWAVLPKNEAPR
ncbi:MAG: haloacid dehalogenase-like hydrolase [Chloroflexi bacterium]|nr:haloacid dehalogenase-like hydrolase [Chloroflexota bacterium]